MALHAARRVEEVIAFDDPAGTSTEVFHGAVLDHSTVVKPFGAGLAPLSTSAELVSGVAELAEEVDELAEEPLR